MKLSQFLACAVLVLVAAVVFQATEARRYNSPATYSDYSPAADSSYSSGGQYNSRQRSAYGPYHSYAVKPAIYGGRGLYHYKGYARHYPAPPASHQPHYRQTRSYSSPSYGSGSSYGVGLKPVRAVVLAPAYYPSRPSSNYASSGSRYSQASAGQNYRHKRGYNSGSYSSGSGPSYSSSSNYHAPATSSHYSAPSSAAYGNYGASQSRYNTRGRPASY